MSHSERLERLTWAVLSSIAVLALFLLLTATADAQGMVGSGNFSCAGARAAGEMLDSGGSCPTTLRFDNVFSFLVCNIEHLSSDLMGGMFCGMVSRLAPLVTGVVTLAVLFFGIGFTIGVIPATAREFQKFLIKMALVVAFATQADLLIGVVYKFLVGGAREGIAIVMSGLNDGTGTGASMYAHLDAFLGAVVHMATDYVGGKWDGESNPCKNAIFAAMAIMAVAFPPLAYFFIVILARIALTFFRAVFGYVYSIVAIAFMLTLAPIFLSMSLFKATSNFFDKWVGYLASFALQMILVFAFLSFVVSIDFKNMSSGLTDIVVPQQETTETTSYRLPWKYCTLCDFKVVDRETGADMAEGDSNFISKGKLQCKDSPPKPISVLSATAPSSASGTPDKKVISTLLTFASTGLLSLLVLAFIVDGVLAIIPQLAQKLAGGAGAPYAPQMGGGDPRGGSSVVHLPGEDMIGSFGRGFQSGYTDAGGNAIGRTAEGMRRGMALMITGKTEDGRESPQDPGLAGTLRKFLINPHGDRQE